MASDRSTARSAQPDEEAFLAGYDASKFPRPSVTVDLVLMTIDEGAMRVLLLQRRAHPGKGKWALPGAFVGSAESLDEAAARVLRSKVGLDGLFVEQLYTFGDPSRDARTRVISVAHFALVAAEKLKSAMAGAMPEPLVAGRVQTPWLGEEGGPVDVLDEGGRPLPLAFDHALMVGTAVKRLRGRLNYSPIGYELLPREFTLRDLRLIHEAILGRPLNKDAFRRRMLLSGDLHATGRLEESVGHRPAELYRFRPGSNR